MLSYKLLQPCDLRVTARCREIVTNLNFAVRNKCDSVRSSSGQLGISGLKEFIVIIFCLKWAGYLVP